MEVFVFVDFFYDNDFAVGRRYNDSVSVFGREVTDRTTVEVDNNTVSYAENDKEYDEWYLCRESKPKKQRHKDNEHRTIEELVAALAVESYFLQFLQVFYFVYHD